MLYSTFARSRSDATSEATAGGMPDRSAALHTFGASKEVLVEMFARPESVPLHRCLAKYQLVARHDGLFCHNFVKKLDGHSPFP